MKIILDDKYYIKEGYGSSYTLVYIRGYKEVVDKETKEVNEVENSAAVAYADIPQLIGIYAKLTTNENNKDKVIELKDYVNQHNAIIKELTKKIL